MISINAFLSHVWVLEFGSGIGIDLFFSPLGFMSWQWSFDAAAWCNYYKCFLSLYWNDVWCLPFEFLG